MGPIHVLLSEGWIGLRLGLGSGVGVSWWGWSGNEGSDEGLPGGEDEIAGNGA